MKRGPQQPPARTAFGYWVNAIRYDCPTDGKIARRQCVCHLVSSRPNVAGKHRGVP
jgi:hypothetical protein